MKIIGLTGGIGSGKSTAARFLKELGAEVIDLDKAGHEVLKKDGGVYKKVVGEFGEGILKVGGEIDRIRLGEIVFNDREALKRLTMRFRVSSLAAVMECQKVMVTGPAGWVSWTVSS